MSATPSPTQLFLADSLPVEPSVEEAPAVCQTDLENDQFQNGWWSLAKRALLALITFSIGVAAALAWQSYGDAARETIAPAASLNAISVDLHAVRRSIDGLAVSIAASTISREQITRSVDQLSAGQEQMTREITKLQAVEQDILERISTPPPRPAPTPKPVLRSQAPIVLTPAKNP
jgi:hypothetical protein